MKYPHPNRPHAGFFMPMKKYMDFEVELSRLAKLTDNANLVQELQYNEKHNGLVVLSDPDFGFGALKLTTRNNQSVLFIWVAISRIKQGIDTALPMIEQIATEAGCTFIEFETTHKGFKRIAKRIGFTPVGKRNIFTVYSKRVLL